MFFSDIMPTILYGPHNLEATWFSCHGHSARELPRPRRKQVLGGPSTTNDLGPGRRIKSSLARNGTGKGKVHRAPAQQTTRLGLWGGRFGETEGISSRAGTTDSQTSKFRLKLYTAHQGMYLFCPRCNGLRGAIKLHSCSRMQVTALKQKSTSSPLMSRLARRHMLLGGVRPNSIHLRNAMLVE